MKTDVQLLDRYRSTVMGTFFYISKDIYVVLILVLTNWFGITCFFISKSFISNPRLKVFKTQAKAKQHPDGKLLLLKIIRFLHLCYHVIKMVGHILKNMQQTKCVCFNEII